jgi:hypothetical protein
MAKKVPLQIDERELNFMLLIVSKMKLSKVPAINSFSQKSMSK